MKSIWGFFQCCCSSHICSVGFFATLVTFEFCQTMCFTYCCLTLYLFFTVLQCIFCCSVCVVEVTVWSHMSYSHTCTRQPPLAPLKIGHLEWVVILKNTFIKGPQTKSGCSRQAFSFYSHCECSINNKDSLEQRFAILCNLVLSLKIKNVLSYFWTCLCKEVVLCK